MILIRGAIKTPVTDLRRLIGYTESKKIKDIRVDTFQGLDETEIYVLNNSLYYECSLMLALF